MLVRRENSATFDIEEFLSGYTFADVEELFAAKSETKKDVVVIEGKTIPRFTNEFWTSKQRQANSIHEISYRACFKPQLPKFFIELLTDTGDTVYDPFSGRGTTAIEAALLNRNVIANDINPVSIILSKPRLRIPSVDEIENRLNEISFDKSAKADIDLSMFYHPETEAEIVSLKKYLSAKRKSETDDYIDEWIRMIATNRLTGHSTNFFSGYTLPPNQAISAEKQKKINQERNQIPPYKDVKKIVLIKSKDLLNDISTTHKNKLKVAATNALFLNNDARFTPEISDNSVKLTVTSPPFLDVVQYDQDNWLRCWFNAIDTEKISGKITMSKKIDDWCSVMQNVFHELHRITVPNGWVAFEVGEVRNGKIKLDEYVVPLGINAGFTCKGILINEQEFTKTANIWGVKNNSKGTNTNRVAIFQK